MMSQNRLNVSFAHNIHLAPNGFRNKHFNLSCVLNKKQSQYRLGDAKPNIFIEQI